MPFFLLLWPMTAAGPVHCGAEEYMVLLVVAAAAAGPTAAAARPAVLRLALKAVCAAACFLK